MSAHFYWLFEKPDGISELPAHVRYAMTTFRSANPDQRIVLHTNARVSTSIPDCVINERNRLRGIPFIPMFINHAVDWLKLDDAYNYGGMFMDSDQLFINEYPEWFAHPGKLYAGSFSGDISELSIGCFSCRAGNPFIKEWKESYVKGYRKIYNWNSCMVPAQMVGDFPDDVSFIPKNKMIYPLTWAELKEIHTSPLLKIDKKALLADEDICSIHFGHGFLGNPRTAVQFEEMAGEILSRNMNDFGCTF
jgi:hypothetical protein